MRTADRELVRPLVTPERLSEFFAPRSIAVVGASDTSGWARFIVASCAATGFSGPLIPVHPAHQTVFGRPAVPSLRDLPEPVDLAFILAPTAAVESVLQDAGAAGVRGAIVLASGYREVGDAGRALQDAMVACAAAGGITVLGPNCLGFLNGPARAGPYALTVPLPLLTGPVGIAMQSGALASVVLSFARARAIGVSTVATMGNEAMISTADMLEYLVQDENTRVICLFLEEIGDPARFGEVAERAAAAGKPIVALKVGSSPAGRQAALAHTGSVAGDDAVVDAALRQLNVIRVTSIEELLCTAALLGYHRWPRGRRMGVLTTSGGACDLIADRAGPLGIQIPPFAAQTSAQISSHLPSFAAVRNPLDSTGYFLANQRTSALTSIDHALDAAVADPGLDFVLFGGITLPDARPPDETAASLLTERLAWLGRRIASAPIPVIPVAAVCTDIAEYGRDLLARNNIHLLGGVDLGVQALANALRWLEVRDLPRPAPRPPAAIRPVSISGPWSELAARELLTVSGVPVVPGELVRSADQAVAAAARLGYPVVLKICSAQITHKSDIGGVALHLRTEADVRTAYARVLAAANHATALQATALQATALPATALQATANDDTTGHANAGQAAANQAITAPAITTQAIAAQPIAAQPIASQAAASQAIAGQATAGEAVIGDGIDGILVAPMRTGGVELLAGVTVDPAFGPVLAVGLGGVWVEVLGDTSLRLLPVDPAEVRRMLGELRGLPLLHGARGTRPADIGALARIVAALGEAAMSLGGALRALEVNPLWVNGDQIEALDVLVITEPTAETGPAGTRPAGTRPAETGPAETGPASTGPASTGPASTEPAGTEHRP